jgi:hypothetical protein
VHRAGEQFVLQTLQTTYPERPDHDEHQSQRDSGLRTWVITIRSGGPPIRFRMSVSVIGSGRLLVTDQQPDRRGTSPCRSVYGQPNQPPLV